MSPSSREILRVMQETGMEYLQARNHLIARYLLQQSMGYKLHLRGAL